MFIVGKWGEFLSNPAFVVIVQFLACCKAVEISWGFEWQTVSSRQPEVDMIKLADNVCEVLQLAAFLPLFPNLSFLSFTFELAPFLCIKKYTVKWFYFLHSMFWNCNYTTVNVWHPNIRISELSKVVPFPNGLDFRRSVYRLEPNQTFGFRTIH